MGEGGVQPASQQARLAQHNTLGAAGGTGSVHQQAVFAAAGGRVNGGALTGFEERLADFYQFRIAIACLERLLDQPPGVRLNEGKLRAGMSKDVGNGVVARHEVDGGGGVAAIDDTKHDACRLRSIGHGIGDLAARGYAVRGDGRSDRLSA